MLWCERFCQCSMIGCVRARASSHARILRPPPVRSLPGSWIVRFGSTHDGPKGSNSQGTNNDTGSSVDGSADNSIPSPSEFHAYPKVDSPSIAAPPTEVVGGTEPWSVAQDALPDVSSSVTPSIADAAVYMLTGALNTGGRIMDAVQSGVQGIHAATGLPWWATIAVVTVGVKISLLPVVVYQARHMDRVRMAWPEIQMLRAHLASTLEQVGRIAFRYLKEGRGWALRHARRLGGTFGVGRVWSDFCRAQKDNAVVFSWASLTCPMFPIRV